MSSPPVMRAAIVSELAGPGAVRIGTLPVPDDADAVLIDVHAAGVSFPDLLMSHGTYQRRPDPPFAPGVEVAGVVRRAAPGSELQVGDRVAAFVRVGGWAEVVAARPEYVFPLPERLTFRAGAGLAMNYLTAHLALTRRARLRPEDTLLVRGAAGGLGTACVQVGRALGATVVAAVSTEEKADIAREAGAHHVVIGAHWREAVHELAPDGVQFVADPVGGDDFLDGVRVLATTGCLLVLGFAGGGIPELAVNRLLLRNLDVRGVAWGALIDDDPGYPAQQWSDIARWIDDGLIRPLDGPVFALEDAGDALRVLETRAAVGKVTLAVRGEAEQDVKTTERDAG